MSFKNILFLCLCIFGLASCKKNTENTIKDIDGIRYMSGGKSITPYDALDPIEVLLQYEVMSLGDTIVSKMEGKVKEVCQAEGCWLVLDLGAGNEVMVNLKKADFFVLRDMVGKDIIVNGSAFIEDVSVEQQRHVARDAGKLEADIAAIKDVKRTWSLLADGVLIKQ